MRKARILILLLLSSSFLGADQEGFAGLGNLSDAFVSKSPEPVVQASLSEGVQQQFYQLNIEVDLPKESYLYAKDSSAFSITSIDPVGEIISFVYPNGVYSEQANRELYTDTVTFFATIQLPKDADLPESLALDYQICDTFGVCYFPQTLWVPITWSDTPLQGAVVTESTTEQPKSSFWIMLLIALAGGVLMNFMPCVLPVLFLRIMAIAKGAGQSRKTLKKDNYLFLLGMGLVIVLLGIVTMIIRSAGIAVGWGFQFQSPLFTMGMIIVLLLFSLSLFNLFELPGVRLSQGSSSVGTVGLGALAAIMAAPCTAPLLGSAIGYALSRNLGEGTLFFLAIALGFVSPLFLITTIPGFWKLIPKPGKWMVWLRVAMGAVLLGLAIYVGSALPKMISQEALRGFLLLLLIISLLICIVSYGVSYTRKKGLVKKKQRIVRTVGVTLCIATVIIGWITYVIPASKTEPSKIDKLPPMWVAFSEEQVSQLEDQNRDIFIAFSATWCSICKINEETLLFLPQGTQFFEEHKITPVYGDFTKFDPTIARWIDSFQRSGVPLYLYKSAEDSEYTILPQMLTLEILENTIRGDQE